VTQNEPAGIVPLTAQTQPNESPRIFLKIAARAATEGPKGCFLMAVNGVPVGWTDPHGASLDWISELPESEG